MQHLNSVVLLISGLGLLTYSFGQPLSDDVRQLEEVTRIALTYDRNRTNNANLSASDKSATGTSSGERGLASLSSIDVLKPPVSAWTTVVRNQDAEPPVIRAPSGQPDKVAIHMPLPSPAPARSASEAKPSAERTKFKLVRDLQRQLRRTECYDGAITGQWSTKTRKAMADFLAATNASLPVDQPDHVLLALVQSHSGLSCGPSQPADNWKTEIAHAKTEADAPKPVVTAIALPIRRPPPAPQRAVRPRPPGLMSVGAASLAARPIKPETRTSTRSVALLVEPIAIDEDEAEDGRGTRMLATPFVSDDDLPQRRGQSRTARLDTSTAPPSRAASPTRNRRIVSVESDDDEASDTFDRPAETRRTVTARPKRSKRRHRANKRRRPSYARYRPRGRTWLRRGSVRFQLRQAISGIY